jgi:hypothetical protein
MGIVGGAAHPQRHSCCPEPFPDLTMTLKIRRKILYYVVNVILPCVVMSVLTLLVFCLPPKSGEKIALGIIVLLAFSVFMLSINSASVNLKVKIKYNFYDPSKVKPITLFWNLLC